LTAGLIFGGFAISRACFLRGHVGFNGAVNAAVNGGFNGAVCCGMLRKSCELSGFFVSGVRLVQVKAFRRLFLASAYSRKNSRLKSRR